MKKIITPLIFASMLSVSSLANAYQYNTQYNRIQSPDGWTFVMPKIQNLPEPVKYNEANPNDSYNAWYKDIEIAARPKIETSFMNVYNKHEDIRLNEQEAVSVLQYIKEKEMAVIWNNLVTNYPKSKNARSAFCQYGKEIGILSTELKQCNKDFSLDPQKHFLMKESKRIKVKK